MYSFILKFWRMVFFSIQNLPREENFNSESFILKKHEKIKKCRFHGVKRNETSFIWMQIFLKIWHVDKVSFQNLRRCIFFSPKSDAL